MQIAGQTGGVYLKKVRAGNLVGLDAAGGLM
jgi:hypothetical protein